MLFRSFEVKKDRMRSYRSLVVRMMAKFQSFELMKIAGQDNTKADRLAKLAASTDFRLEHQSPIDLLEAPFIRYSESVLLVNTTDISGSWIQPIYEYIKDGVQPVDKQQARKLRIRSARYMLIDDVLFR